MGNFEWVLGQGACAGAPLRPSDPGPMPPFLCQRTLPPGPLRMNLLFRGATPHPPVIGPRTEARWRLCDEFNQ